MIIGYCPSKTEAISESTSIGCAYFYMFYRSEISLNARCPHQLNTASALGVPVTQSPSPKNHPGTSYFSVQVSLHTFQCHGANTAKIMREHWCAALPVISLVSLSYSMPATVTNVTKPLAQGLNMRAVAGTDCHLVTQAGQPPCTG